MKEDLNRALAQAASFPGSRPPDDAEEIGRVESGGTTFIVYRGKTRGYYYNTTRGLCFAREMEEAQARRKEAHRRRAEEKARTHREVHPRRPSTAM